MTKSVRASRPSSRTPSVDLGALQSTLTRARLAYTSADSKAKSANAALQRAKSSLDSAQRTFDEAARAISMG